MEMTISIKLFKNNDNILHWWLTIIIFTLAWFSLIDFYNVNIYMYNKNLIVQS